MNFVNIVLHLGTENILMILNYRLPRQLLWVAGRLLGSCLVSVQMILVVRSLLMASLKKWLSRYAPSPPQLERTVHLC